jgi:hypothetical protein
MKELDPGNAAGKAVGNAAGRGVAAGIGEAGLNFAVAGETRTEKRS